MSLNRPPVIGVTSRFGNADWLHETTRNYLAVLADYGVQAVPLAPDTPAHLPDGAVYTPDADGRLPAAVLQHLDGLILAGGGDVHPRYFGQPLAGAEPEQIDLRRDELELNLARAAMASDLPILGICRGCQVLNVAAGGAMVQHLDGHRSPKDGVKYHDVTVAAGSKLHQIVGADRLAVNTYHHQGMNHAVVAPAFTPVGQADPDAWLVEAYESRSHRWLVGVQWHPERLFELEPAHRRLWDSFLAACGVPATSQRE
jgi:putative glutamine amidotransferase